jgi:8-oxo-dGTP diphosphatase
VTNVRALTEEARRDGIEKLVVGAVIHRGDHVLILRRSEDDAFLPGIEELPSGGVEDGEDLLTALVRELSEEIGWTGRLTLDPAFVASFDYVSGSGRRTRQYTFAALYEGHEIRLSDEHRGHLWITAAGLDGSDLTAESVQTIREWAAFNPRS